MFKFPKMIATVALALLASHALAEPVVLGSVGKTYGSATGQTAHYASDSSCVQTASVTVSDSSSTCGSRFSDSFDFSGIAGASVSSLQLALSFSGTNDVFAFFFPEDWKVRPASGPVGSNQLFDMVSSSGAYTQLFTFTAANLDVFDSIVRNQRFDLWFADEALGANKFNLLSARLDVVGVLGITGVNTVPEPSVLALIALAVLGVAWSRRRSATARPWAKARAGRS